MHFSVWCIQIHIAEKYINDFVDAQTVPIDEEDLDQPTNIDQFDPAEDKSNLVSDGGEEVREVGGGKGGWEEVREGGRR